MLHQLLYPWRQSELNPPVMVFWVRTTLVNGSTKQSNQKWPWMARISPALPPCRATLLSQNRSCWKSCVSAHSSQHLSMIFLTWVFHLCIFMMCRVVEEGRDWRYILTYHVNSVWKIWICHMPSQFMVQFLCVWIPDKPVMECDETHVHMVGTKDARIKCRARMNPDPDMIMWTWGEDSNQTSLAAGESSGKFSVEHTVCKFARSSCPLWTSCTSIYAESLMISSLFQPLDNDHHEIALVIDEVEEEDFGKYKLQISNSIGSKEHHLHFKEGQYLMYACLAPCDLHQKIFSFLSWPCTYLGFHVFCTSYKHLPPKVVFHLLFYSCLPSIAVLHYDLVSLKSSLPNVWCCFSW